MELVPEEGIEPSLPFGNRILNPARLPVPPPRHAGKYMRGKALPPEQKKDSAHATISMQKASNIPRYEQVC
jgi:hypothetical protein